MRLSDCSRLFTFPSAFRTKWTLRQPTLIKRWRSLILKPDSLEIISISFSVIVSMWILIPAFTMQQETVSKYFINTELRDWKTIDRFVRRRKGWSGPNEDCSWPMRSTVDRLPMVVYHTVYHIVYHTVYHTSWFKPVKLNFDFQYAKGWNWLKANGTHWRWVTRNTTVNVKWSDSRPFTLNRLIQGHLFR